MEINPENHSAGLPDQAPRVQADPVQAAPAPVQASPAPSAAPEKKPLADLRSLDEILPPELRSKGAQQKPTHPLWAKARKILKKSPVGARVFKSALALCIAMTCGKALGIGTVYATPAIWGMQPTVGESFKSAKRLMKLQTLAFIPTFILGLTIGPNIVSLFIAVILIYQIGIKLKMANQCTIGIVASIFVLTSPPDAFLRTALTRSFGVMMGLTIAIIINRLIWPPQYRAGMVSQAIQLNEMITRYFRQSVQAYLDNQPIERKERNRIAAMLESEFRAFDKKYNYFCSEQIQFSGPNQAGEETEEEKEQRFFEAYADLCRNMIILTKDNWALADEQTQRLKRWKDEEINPVDPRIPELITEALDRLEECNQELFGKLTGAEPLPFRDPHIWERMDLLLTEWHNTAEQNRTNLHSLVEISLVTYRIRWTLKRVLSMLIMEPCHMPELPRDF